VFPVRYELKFYIVFSTHLAFKGLRTCALPLYGAGLGYGLSLYSLEIHVVILRLMTLERF
jgi:hypothetical protein